MRMIRLPDGKFVYDHEDDAAEGLIRPTGNIDTPKPKPAVRPDNYIPNHKPRVCNPVNEASTRPTVVLKRATIDTGENDAE